jgi:hypothetical protein
MFVEISNFLKKWLDNRKINIPNPNDKKFQGIGTWASFWNLLYGCPWTLPKTFHYLHHFQA